MEDANFERSVANQAIIYLFNEEEWIMSVLADARNNTLREGDLSFMDRTLLNEIDFLVEASFIEFEGMRYRDGLHRCWFDMVIARGIILKTPIRFMLCIMITRSVSRLGTKVQYSVSQDDDLEVYSHSRGYDLSDLPALVRRHLGEAARGRCPGHPRG